MKTSEQETTRPSIDKIFLQKGITYQGKPCRHGHPGIRYVKGGECVDCSKRYNYLGYRNRKRQKQLAA
jgi:hypothetical protein